MKVKRNTGEKGEIIMDMTGYLGKKIDMICVNGKKYSGYICDI